MCQQTARVPWTGRDRAVDARRRMLDSLVPSGEPVEVGAGSSMDAAGCKRWSHVDVEEGAKLACERRAVSGKPVEVTASVWLCQEATRNSTNAMCPATCLFVQGPSSVPLSDTTNTHPPLTSHRIVTLTGTQQTMHDLKIPKGDEVQTNMGASD